MSDSGNQFNFISFKAAFFMLIALAVGGTIVGSFLGIALFWGKTGGDFQAINQLMSDAKNFRALQIIQTVTVVFGMLIPTYYVATRLTKSPFSLLGLQAKLSNKNLFTVLGITLLAVMFSSGLGYLSYQLPLPKNVLQYFTQLENDYTKTVLTIIQIDSIGELLISLFILALLPAVCEELLFRGGLQNFLCRWTQKPWLSIIIVSFIFSAVHFSGFGFLSRFALGVILGFLFHKTGSLWSSILTHFINNALAVFMVYFYAQKGKPLQDVMTDKSGSYWGLLAVVGIVYLFTILKPSTKDNLSNGI